MKNYRKTNQKFFDEPNGKKSHRNDGNDRSYMLHISYAYIAMCVVG